MDKAKRTIHAAHLLASWRGIERETVSVEAALYTTLLLQIPVVHTVHDQGGNPIFLIVDRDAAIDSVKEQYNLISKGDPLSLPEKAEA
jgi:hypothetical protein